MTRFFSSPTSSASYTKEVKELVREEPKILERAEGSIRRQTGAASPTTTTTPATAPSQQYNKLRKPRPFSFSMPSSKKKSGSISFSPSEQQPIQITMPFSKNSSSSDSISSSATPPSPTAPSKIQTESKPRMRTISLRSVRSLSTSMIRHGHSHSASVSTTSSTQSNKEFISSSGSVTSISTSPSVSPVKKVTSRVKNSIRRLGDSLHLPHVTPKSRTRPTSAPGFDHHHPSHPSHVPSTSSRKSDSSQGSSDAKFKEDVNERKAETNHGAPESISEGKQVQEEASRDQESESHLRSEVIVESSSAVTSGDSDEPQVSDSLIIVSTVLSPVAEMPTPVSPAVPVPSAIRALERDTQPQDILSSSGPALNTSVYVEAEVPDPFLLDEEGDAMSDEEKEEHARTQGLPPTPPEPPAAQEIALNTSTAANIVSPVASEVSLQSPLNVNKDVTPPPPEVAQQDDAQEGEVPDLFLPGLVIPTMLLPIPNTDPLTTLLTKYIYPPEKRPVRDVSGEWKRTDIHTLVMTNSWRALGRMARDRIVASRPTDVENILALWYLRLASLAHLRLYNQTAAECTNLFAVLNAIEPMDHRIYVFDNLLPFELEVMYARVKYWSSDHMGYLDALSALLRKCKRKAREAFSVSKNEDEVQEIKSMWKERGARMSLILASQLVEMKDFTAATKLLEPLCNQPTNTTGAGPITNPNLRSAIARIYLQGGNVQLAAYHFALVAQDPTADESLKKMNEAILNAAEGEWERTVVVLKDLIKEDEENFVAVNNLSVALLSQGKLKEAIEVLEKALKLSPSTVVVAEPFLFNLSTLYELRSAAGLERKKNLLIEVAKWSGDGLRTNCLKMPTN